MNKKICPKCNSIDVKDIFYSIPPDTESERNIFWEDIEKENLYWKDDIKFCSCDWHCIKCHYEWDKNGEGHYDNPGE